MKENNIKLYSKDSKGKIRIWEVYSQGNIIFFEYGLLDGTKTLDNEPVSEGLASRTLKEQVESRINSRVNKKKDAGYVESLDDAINNNKTNSLGFKKPAKCSRYDQRKDKIPFDITFVQSKLDGHHCNIVNDHGTNIAYSSNGKIIDSVPEIVENIKIPVGQVVEGELYHHGTPLQTISSWVKKKQKDSDKLNYFMYDIDGEDCYSKRIKELESIKHGDRSVFMKTVEIHGKFDVIPLMQEHLKGGYEGLVLRLLGYPHKDGGKSNGLIKVKTMHFGELSIDDEFLVVDIKSSKEGCAVLQCMCNDINGGVFGVVAPGSKTKTRLIYECKDLYLGKHVRVQYSGLTKDKKPFHPVALEWREKFDE